MTAPMESMNVRDLDLETTWTLWYDKKKGAHVNASNNKKKESPKPRAEEEAPKKKRHTKDDWKKNLISIGDFNTVLGFWNYHAWMKKPSELSGGVNIYMMRNNLEPMWETFPNGGCWIIRFHKNHSVTGVIDRVWEQLLVAVLGEQFRTPELVGVSLSVRGKYQSVSHIVSVWNRDTVHKKAAQFRIGERLKILLNLDPKSTIEYKFFSKALEDHSTFRGAQPYSFVPT